MHQLKRDEVVWATWPCTAIAPLSCVSLSFVPNMTLNLTLMCPMLTVWSSPSTSKRVSTGNRETGVEAPGPAYQAGRSKHGLKVKNQGHPSARRKACGPTRDKSGRHASGLTISSLTKWLGRPLQMIRGKMESDLV